MLNRKRILIEERKAEEAKAIMICPGCEETAYAKDVPELRCPNCEVDLETLKGYYDRHPELKEELNDRT